MANPRTGTSILGTAADYQTFRADATTIPYSDTVAGGSVAVGLAVTMHATADDTVALIADGDRLEGKLIRVEGDGRCTVQTGGGMELPAGASAAVTLGAAVVGALGAASAKGYVRAVAATTGSYVQGTATDALRGRGTIVNNDVTTALAINLH